MNTTYTLRDAGSEQEHPARRVIGAIRDWYAVDYDFGASADGTRIRPSKASILRAWREARQAEKAENPDGPVDLERLAYWYADRVSRLVTSTDDERNEWLAYMGLHVQCPEQWSFALIGAGDQISASSSWGAEGLWYFENGELTLDTDSDGCRAPMGDAHSWPEPPKKMVRDARKADQRG